MSRRILTLSLILVIGVLAFVGSLRPRAGVPEGLATPSSEGLSQAQRPDRVLASAARPEAKLRSAQEPDVLVGLVVEHRSQTPIPGVQVRLIHSDDSLSTVTSAADGSFLFPKENGAPENAAPDASPVKSAQVLGSEEWWCHHHGLSSGRYLIHLAPADIGPVHAQLVDSNSFRPVPHYLVRLKDSLGWSETLRTDHEGRFKSTMIFTAGTLRLLTQAEEIGGQYSGELLVTHEHFPDGAQPPLATIPIRTGPTFQLHLNNPGQVPLKRLVAHVTSSAWVATVAETPSQGVDVRPGDPTWVRFPEPLAELQSPELVIVDAGGNWLGHVPLGLAPFGSTPLQVTLKPVVRLRGRVLDPGGMPVAQTQVELISTSLSSATVRTAHTSGNGVFMIAGIDPGPYDLRASHRFEGTARAQLELAMGGKHPDVEVVLRAYPTGGHISGVVRSMSGDFNGEVSLHLIPSEKTSLDLPQRSVLLAWAQTSDGFQAPFTFTDVAQGSYWLRGFHGEGRFDLAPAELKVTPPSSDLELIVRDDHERPALSLKVVDAATGDWLPSAEIRVLDGQGKELYGGVAAGLVAKVWLKREGGFQWRVTCDGYNPSFGGNQAFDALGLNSGGYTARLLMWRD